VTEHFYSNRYVLGNWLRPLGLVLAQTLEVLFRGPIILLVTAVVAIWLSGLVFGWNPPWPNLSNRQNIIRTVVVWSLVGAMAVVCVAWLVNTWVRFLLILRARAYVAAGSPLLCMEGPAIFSGGSKGNNRGGPSYSPISLKVGERYFDLVACASRHELEAVRTLPYVQSKSDARGAAIGFQVDTPFRVWYTPSGVIVRAEIDVPQAYLDPARRSQFLKEKWEQNEGSRLPLEERKRIAERLAQAEQRRKNMSPAEIEEAEKKIQKLKLSFRGLGGRRPEK